MRSRSSDHRGEPPVAQSELERMPRWRKDCIVHARAVNDMVLPLKVVYTYKCFMELLVSHVSRSKEHVKPRSIAETR